MNHQEIQFSFLRPEEWKQTERIIVEANLLSFPLLIHKYQTLQSFQKKTRELIEDCFKYQQIYSKILNKPIHYNFGVRINKRLIAVMLGIDMTQQYKLMQPFFGKNQFETMFQSLNIEELPIGNSVYFTRLSVLPQVMGKGIGKRLVYQSAKYLLEQGYKQSIMGSLVEVSRKMFMGLGGELLIHQQAVRPNFTYQINIIKNDFQKLLQVFQSNK